MLAAPPKAGERPRRTRLTYRPALDGLRALAVVAVFAYHARLPWARAGFLGVDVFFVLSGYLITALLLVEHTGEGRIDLVRFWCRRARRLLPAVIALLAVVAVAVPLLAPEQAYRLRADLLAALGYVSNWRFILEDQSYFQAAGRPPVLQHLWSLAVEEQFYLAWPVAMMLALRPRRAAAGVASRARVPGRLVLPLLAAATASAALMAILHEPYRDPSRVYYGTDTRATALLVGAALACATVRWQLVDQVHRKGRWVLEALGAAGLGVLAWAVIRVDEFDPRLYEGGFLAVALAAAAVVASAARPGSRGALTAVLGSRPLVWLGRRSYAVYLWFWPVLMLTRPHVDIPLSGLPLLALRIALTVALAALSYRFVERPARLGALGRVWADLRRARRERVPLHRPSAAWALGLTAAILCVGTGLAITRPPADAAVNLNRRAAAELEAVLSASRVTTTLAPTTVPPTTAAPAEVAPDPSVPTTTASGPELPVVSTRVTAIGDSVLLGAKPLLERQVEGIVVDAEVGRQLSDVLSAARVLRENGSVGEAVILQTGNNGPISREQLDQLLELFRDVPRVVVVNVKVDRAWEGHNNEVMSAAVPRWPNARLVDWHHAATNSADAFYDDGLHLTPAGMTLFAQLVLSAL